MDIFNLKTSFFFNWFFKLNPNIFHDLFDEGQALEVDSMVARAIGEAFTAYIGQDILARNRVAIIFDTFCLKTDSSDDDDHWATDYVAISKKLQRVILHVPFYYALIKEKES